MKRMLLTLILTGTILAGVALIPSESQAGVKVYLNVGGGPSGYCPPPRAAYYPYYQYRPAPVYYRSTPVTYYYGPQPVYYNRPVTVVRPYPAYYNGRYHDPHCR